MPDAKNLKKMSGNMNLTLKVWRQKNASDKGGFVTYKADGISPDMSFLEMLDVVNERLVKKFYYKIKLYN